MIGKKRLLAVHHADGRTEYLCPKCGGVMVHDDNYRMYFKDGEISETGGEFLTCHACGMTSDYPRMRVSDFRKIPEIG